MSIIDIVSLLLLTFGSVNAIPWNGPRPTGSDELGVNWSPRPTGAIYNQFDLFKRAGQYPLSVCGFISGDLGECAGQAQAVLSSALT